jgi:hypothetical protein
MQAKHNTHAGVTTVSEVMPDTQAALCIAHCSCRQHRASAAVRHVAHTTDSTVNIPMILPSQPTCPSMNCYRVQRVRSVSAVPVHTMQAKRVYVHTTSIHTRYLHDI